MTLVPLKYVYTVGFSDPKVGARDPKLDRDPPVDNHCSKAAMSNKNLTFATFFKDISGNILECCMLRN